MITGAFSFLLFIFSTPQTVLTNKLVGTWEVEVDSTDSRRDFWKKIYAFETCEEPDQLNCRGTYGFVDEPEVLTNLLDKSYFIFGVERKKGENKSRALFIDSEPHHFELSSHQKVLTVSDSTGVLLMKMIKKD